MERRTFIKGVLPTLLGTVAALKGGKSHPSIEAPEGSMSVIITKNDTTDAVWYVGKGAYTEMGGSVNGRHN